MSKAQSRWLLVTVLLVISLAMAAFAGGEPRTNVPPGGLWVYNTASDTWVPVAADENGYLRTIAGTTTVTLPDPVVMDGKYDYVMSVNNKQIDSVATNAATIISTVASITPPCVVQLSCPAGELWYAPGVATTTIDSIKFHVLEEKQSVTFRVATTTWDLSIGGVSAVSSGSVSVHTLGR